MLPINGKSIATADVILIKALTKHAYNKKKDPWRYGLNSALPWPDRGNEITQHNRGFKKFREDIGKSYNQFNLWHTIFFNNSLLVCAVVCIWHQSDCHIRVCILHQSCYSIWISCTNHSIWVLFFFLNNDVTETGGCAQIITFTRNLGSFDKSYDFGLCKSLVD